MSDNQEYLEDGYIKISRRVFSSKTFLSLNAIQKLVTFYLILMANHQDNKWWDNHEKKFIDIKRGSFVTSVEQIRKKINDRLVTPKKIRLILSSLEKMEFLAIKTTNKYTLITILKYDLYQNGTNYEGKQKGKLRASKGQVEGKQRATNNNGNKEKNDKKRDTLSSRCVLIIDYLNEKTGRTKEERNCFDPKAKSNVDLIRARFNEGRTVKDFITVIDNKLIDWLDNEKMFEFLRPSTLFSRGNFENYVNQKKKDKYDKYLRKE